MEDYERFPGARALASFCSTVASSKIAESFNKLLEGVAVTLPDGTRTTVTCMLTQFKADWKFHRDPWLAE